MKTELSKSRSLARVLRFTGVLTCSLGPNGERYPVASLREASDKYQAFRDRGGFGASEIPEGVVWCDGVRCATISYNGRVWDTEGEEVRVAEGRKAAAEHEAEGWRDCRVFTLTA